MSPYGWVIVVACAGQLALFVVAVGRGARSPLGMPLALFSLLLFSWNFCSLAFDVSQHLQWRWLALAAAPLANAVGLHLILSFVGRRRALAWLLYLGYAVFGGLAAWSLLAFLFPALRPFIASAMWAMVLGLLMGSNLVLVVSLLHRHQQRALDVQEQMRTRLILLAMVLLVMMAGTDLSVLLGVDTPRLGGAGSLFCNLLLAVVVMRLRLFGRDLSTFTAVSATTLAVLAVVTYVLVFRFLAADTSLLAVATTSVTLALLALSRRVLVARALLRERMDRLATLGRFSAQMAHDIKNPLAALKGAAQFLREEHAQGRSLADKGEFLDLIGEQINRVERVVEHYQRLGRVEPALQPTSLNALVKRVLALQGFAGSETVKVRAELAEGLPDCPLDHDLVAGALENLVRNAFEAMPRGGTVTVRTGRADDFAERVFVAVEDTGEGMDARTRERAFDDFYTTKPTGSGMGLAFVRRVVEAHGGSLSLDSREKLGTEVRLTFPSVERA